MIAPPKALQILLKSSRQGPLKKLFLKQSFGHFLAEDIISPVNLPHWDNSAMDGFALRSLDTAGASVSRPAFLKIAATIQAGEPKTYSLKKGEAARIMTGAPLPSNADTILIKEDAVIANDRLKIVTVVESGRHIRRKGEEIQKRERIKLKGRPLNAGLIAFLASLGKNKVEVYAKPAVAVISTGSELVHPGKPLAHGKIYDSNSVMVNAALRELGLEPVFTATVSDDRRRLHIAVVSALKRCDVLILTGGVSAGEYDYCRQIFKDLGVKTLFWKVSQKPGKPLFVGRLKRRLIFGLPGNPASVHLCFNEYVAPSLLRIMGHRGALSPDIAYSATRIRRDRSKTLFLKARLSYVDGKRIANILPRQGSHMISTLHETSGFVVVDPGPKDIQKGEKVMFDGLPSWTNAS